MRPAENLSTTTLRYWLRFFVRNDNYREYCNARRNNSSSACKVLEEKFPRIAELYDDWGDIHADDLVGSIDRFREWVKPRDQLFFFYSSVQWIEHPETYIHRPGFLLLDVPIYEKRYETLKHLEWFIKFHYTMAEKIRKGVHRESSIPAVRLVMQPIPRPKYVLYEPGGKLTAANFSNVRKAYYVDRISRHAVEEKQLSITETVLKIKQDSKNPLGWSMTKNDSRAFKSGTFAKSILNGSEMTLVKRYRRDFEAYVRNTIHGRFPDNS